MTAMEEGDFHRVGPPVSVVEDETEDDYEEYPWSWKINKSARPESPPVENVIKSFNQELDQLTQNLDDVLALQQVPWSHTNDYSSLPAPAHNNRSYSSNQYTYSTGELPPRMKDPPATASRRGLEASSRRVSPFGTYHQGTPVDGKHLHPLSTPAEQPPDPVQTPSFPRFETSATPARGRRNDDTGSRMERTLDERQLYKEAEDIDSSWRGTLEKMRQTLSQQDERIRDLERENEDLRQQLNAQTQALLQDERHRTHPPFGEEASAMRRSHREEPEYNRRPRDDASVNRGYHTDPQVYREDPSVLGDVAATPTYRRNRQQSTPQSDLRDQPSMSRGYRTEPRVYSRDDPSVDQGGGERPTRQQQTSHRQEPAGRIKSAASAASSPYQSYQSPARIRSPPRRIHNNMGSVATTTAGESLFSPGTCFVGELARLMKMEQGHHAPLSVILDRHWDQLRNHFHTERM